MDEVKSIYCDRCGEVVLLYPSSDDFGKVFCHEGKCIECGQRYRKSER